MGLKGKALALVGVVAMAATFFVGAPTAMADDGSVRDWNRLSDQAKRSSYGWFAWTAQHSGNALDRRLANDAMNEFNGKGQYASKTRFGAEGDATSVENTRAALRMLDDASTVLQGMVDEPCRTDLPAGKGRKCDDPNKRVNRFKAGFRLLGAAQQHANQAAYLPGHQGHEMYGENLAWSHSLYDRNGYPTSVRQWVDEERAAYDRRGGEWVSSGDDMNGHYINMTRPNLTCSAYGISTYKDGAYPYASNTVAWDYTQYYGDQCSYTGSQMLSMFDQYIAMVDAQKVDRAQVDRQAAQHRDDLKDGTYRFKAGTGLVLDVDGANAKQGANVHQWSDNRGSAQWWDVSHDDKGYVTLRSSYGTVLDVNGGVAYDGANVQTWNANGTYGQKWIAVKDGDGSYRLLSAANPKWALDVNGGGSNDGANVQTWGANDSNAQKWTPIGLPSGDKDKEGRSPVYRLYKPSTGEHLYTMGLGEYATLVRKDWQGEDIAFHAWDKDSGVGDEVYRLYNPATGRHHLTMSAGERDALVGMKWKYEGIAFRYKTTDPTIYRGYNPNTSDHLWTLSKPELDNAVKNGWRDEGIAFGQGKDKKREAGFTDVDSGTPHAKSIDWMDANGISTGWWEKDAHRTYRPTSKVTRQDYAAFLHRLAGGKDGSKTAKTFTDVTGSTPHKADIDWATAEGIITGYDDDTFKGMDSIQRQDAVAMLWRLAGSPEPTKAAAFTDVNEDTPHAKAIAWAQESGVTTGMSDGSFGVGKPIIRQDMAAMLQRADGVIQG